MRRFTHAQGAEQNANLPTAADLRRLADRLAQRAVAGARLTPKSATVAIVADDGAIAPSGGLDQKLRRVLPEWPDLMALGQREHELARLPEGRDLAAVLKFDRLGEFSRPGHAGA
jgi:hypothetical protein